MKVLVINSGSSSLKFQLANMPGDDILIDGIIERIGIDGSFIKFKANGEKVKIDKDIANHREGLNLLLEILQDSQYNIIHDINEIEAVGHRVVHGGEFFANSVLINEDVMSAIEECSNLAPLHNPANKTGILVCQELLPNAKNVAVFDTAFHQTMTPEYYLYAIPYDYYRKYKIRRYGFHGSSHRYVSNRAVEILGKTDIKVVTCHVGNGGSCAAINAGKTLDTSMGFTPLEGLMMGTRSGDIDPSIVTFLMEKEGLSTTEINNILNKKSGVLGVSEISSDLREIEDLMAAGDPKGDMIANMYLNKVLRYIGIYNAELDGADAIVLTAGVFENSPLFRGILVNKLAWLGVKLDEEANNCRGTERIISTPDSRIPVIVIPTNEEYIIAKDTFELCS